MSSTTSRRSRRQRWFFAVMLLFTAMMVTVGLVVMSRLRGPTPDVVDLGRWEIEIERIDDGGTNAQKNDDNRPLRATVPDPRLGHRHQAGRFLVRLQHDYTFTMTHLPDTLRITRPLETYQQEDEARPPLWIFGCSFTHGWSVNDEETFPWYVQRRLPQYDVVNFGVSGYGQVHALLQFDEAIKKRRAPELVVVTYAHFHDERNTFGRSYRKRIVANLPPQHHGLPVPSAWLDDHYQVRITSRPARYVGLIWLQWLPPLDAVDELLGRIDQWLIRSHDVSKALVLELAHRCRQRDIPLVVAGITQEPATWDLLAFCLRQGIAQVDISFDYEDPTFMNAPYDPLHPSAAGHRVFAQRLVDFLQQAGFTSGESPAPPADGIHGAKSARSRRVALIGEAGF